MNYQEQTTNNPIVFEQSAIRVSAAADTDVTVLADVPSIHARLVDVLISADADIDSVSIVVYGIGKLLSVTVQISGVILANTPTALRYGDTPAMNQAVGDFYDIVVHAHAAAGPALVTIWTAARS